MNKQQDYWSTGLSFAESALCSTPVLSDQQVQDWFVERQASRSFSVNRIPFSEMQEWAVSAESGNLVHESGKFFTIRGIEVETNWGTVPAWQQPIIDQPEIGFLGFIVKRLDGVLHFLVQAKMEPGNINNIQLAPTLQATRSNFTLVHRGRKPPYLDYFQSRSNHTVLLDVLQSEQGARFLRKRNRNIILEVEEELPVFPDYCWMTLGQLLKAMSENNRVNMDARTVLSSIPYNVDAIQLNRDTESRSLLNSLNPKSVSENCTANIISWFTDQKFRYEMNVEPIALSDVSGWVKTEMDIHHVSHRFFSVIACSVEADNREVASWRQPMVRAAQKGLIAFIVKNFGNVLHFLVQAKVEPGNFDVVEMAPTVQCITGSYEDVNEEYWPPYLRYVLSAKPSQILFDTYQSEEGGRFYREENRNLIIMADDRFVENVGSRFVWMTLAQLKHFIQYNNFVNVQARCLLSCLNVAKGLL